MYGFVRVPHAPLRAATGVDMAIVGSDRALRATSLNTPARKRCGLDTEAWHRRTDANEMCRKPAGFTVGGLIMLLGNHSAGTGCDPGAMMQARYASLESCNAQYR